MLTNPNADITVMQKDAIDISFSWIDSSLGNRLHGVPDVEVVDPVLVAWASSEDLRFFFAFGYEPTSLAVRRNKVIEGKPASGPRRIALAGKPPRTSKKVWATIAALRHAVSDRRHLRDRPGHRGGRWRGHARRGTGAGSASRVKSTLTNSKYAVRNRWTP